MKPFWRNLDSHKPLPIDPRLLIPMLRSSSSSQQAEFLFACAEYTSWRQLPQLKRAALKLWPRAVPPKSHAELERAIHLAHLFYYWGEHGKSQRHLASASAFSQISRREKGLIAWIRAKNAASQRQLTEAYRNFRQAERLLTERYPRERGRLCGSLGLFYRQIGEPEKARFWIRQGLEYLRHTKDEHSQAMLYGNLGHLSRELGRYSEALLCFQKDRELGKKVGDIFGQMLNGNRIAEIYRLLRKNHAAERSYREVLNLGASHPEQSYVVHAMLGLSRILAQRKRFGEAKDWFKKARERIGKAKHLRLRYGLAVKVTQARLYRHLGRLSAARRILLSAMEDARRAQDVYQRVRVLYDIARVEILMEREDSGRRRLLQALHLAEQAGLHDSIIWCERLLAENFAADLAAVRLGRYIGQEKARRIMSSARVHAAGSRRVQRTILSGDLRGFTRMSEKLSADRVTRILNRYFDSVAGCVDRLGGNIDKFMGDGFLAVFPGTASGVRSACQAARILQRETQDLNLMMRNDLNGYHLSIGLGLDHGSVVEGEVGSSRRFDYTVIGDTVNTASRLQELAAAGEILLTPRVVRFLPNFSGAQDGLFRILSHGTHRLPGKSKRMRLFRLETLAGTPRS